MSRREDIGEKWKKAPGLSCKKRNTLRGISNNAKEVNQGRDE
jgi:hypothetical protein